MENDDKKSVALNNTSLDQNSNQNLKQTPSGFKVGIPKFQQRVAQAQVQASLEFATAMKHRIGLLLDLSGSMNEYEGLPKAKIDFLKEACEGFIQFCNWSETAVALQSFPNRISRPLIASQSVVMLELAQLSSGGGTPMGEAMQLLLASQPITRAVMISDGQPTDYLDPELVPKWKREASAYAESETQIDTVHIGKSQSGAEVLQEIARITGGIYIKFEDVSSFARSFKFLSPGFRAMLAASNEEEAKKMLGASEVKI